MMEPVAWLTKTRMGNIAWATWQPAGEPLVRLSDAEARRATLEAVRVEELEIKRTLQDYVAQVNSKMATWVARCAEAEARAEAAEVLLKEAGKALRPFSDVAREWDGEDDALHVFLEWEDGTPAQSLPVVDFRAARAIHHKIGVKDGE